MTTGILAALTNEANRLVSTARVHSHPQARMFLYIYFNMLYHPGLAIAKHMALPSCVETWIRARFPHTHNAPHANRRQEYRGSLANDHIGKFYDPSDRQSPGRPQRNPNIP